MASARAFFFLSILSLNLLLNSVSFAQVAEPTPTPEILATPTPTPIATPTPTPTPEPLTCPTTNTPIDIAKWRETLIGRLAPLATQYEGAETTAQEVFANINQCYPSGAPRCAIEVQTYAMEKKSDLYYVEPPVRFGTQFLPPELQAAPFPNSTNLVNIHIPPDFLDLAARKGWLVSQYQTRSTGGFNNAPNLVIVSIPGDKWDVWFQYSPFPVYEPDGSYTPIERLTPDQLVAHQSTLTVIAVDKEAKPKKAELFRTAKVDANRPYDFVSESADRTSCQGCHAQPLRSISPRGYKFTNPGEITLPQDLQDKAAEINARISAPGVGWGTTVHNGFEILLSQDHHGMPVGWAPAGSETRKDAFIQQCVADAEEQSYSGFGGYYATIPRDRTAVVDPLKIASTMNCYGCHNSQYRGALNYISSSEILFKVVVDRSMPPGANLTTDERLVLYQCIMSEKEVLQNEWIGGGHYFRRQKCDPNQTLRIVNPTPVPTPIVTPTPEPTTTPIPVIESARGRVNFSALLQPQAAAHQTSKRPVAKKSAKPLK